MLAYDLSLQSGDELTRNFGNYRPAVVEGVKFVDRNGNGIRDEEDPVFPGGEPGLAGVILYADLNNNAMLDRGEPSAVSQSDDLATPEVDETGFYRLSPPATPTGESSVRDSRGGSFGVYADVSCERSSRRCSALK